MFLPAGPFTAKPVAIVKINIQLESVTTDWYGLILVEPGVAGSIPSVLPTS